MIDKINKIKGLINTNDNIVSLYQYGSQVYGTSNPQSDMDMIMVVKDLNGVTNQSDLSDIDITIYDMEGFQNQINAHEISVLECVFLPEDKILKNQKEWDFILDLPTLRKACSAKSSNSWVKAKKKLIVEEDYNLYVGQKSAWHAIRILQFGQQIAINSKIIDYSSANEFLHRIISCNDWEALDKNMRSVYNEESSKFKLVAPKEVVINNKLKMK
jgi:predicted nucleotidyltransferase